MLARVTVAALSIAGFSACDDHDIGKACEELDGDTSPTVTAQRTETKEVVAQDPGFGCEEMICVASDGADGYCSKKCRNDQGCPEGFTCREVVPGSFASQLGDTCNTDNDCDEFSTCELTGAGDRACIPFGAGDQFCTWKRCNAPADCGNVEEFCCVTSIAEDADGNTVKLCEFKDGSCPE